MAEQRIAHLEEAMRILAAGCDIAIQDQQERIQQLEEALKPAAVLAEIYGDSYPDEERVMVKLEWLRAARAALASLGEPRDGEAKEE